MARAGWLTLGAALAIAGSALAAGPCEEGRDQTGLTLGVGPAGLVVALVDPDSAASESGLRAGDAIVQVNAVLPTTCGEWVRAVREARHDRKALLVLVRRDTAEVPLALGSAVWARAIVTRPETPPVPPAEAPSVKETVTAAPPPPLPPETEVTLDEVTRAIADLAPADHPPTRLETYRHDLTLVRQKTEALAARGTVPAPVVGALKTVLRYYSGARVAWDAEQTLREREYRPSRVPTAEAATAPFFTGSEVEGLVDEFPFLRATVVRDPSRGVLASESSGLWRPVPARQLLWEHGREELARHTAWLEKGTGR
jgi:hypothetical protein